MAARELTIDKEFASIGRKLTPEEESLLEASIDTDGCLDPIITWANHDDTVLDGHNRYRICNRIGKSFTTKAITLTDRDACKQWIHRHQLGKRNVTPDEAAYHRGCIYNVEKKADGVRGPQKLDKNCPASTAERLAAEFGVKSPTTIKNDAKFAEAIDTLAKVNGKEVKTEILSGRSGLTKKEVVEIASKPAAQQAKALKAADSGERKSRKEGETKTDVDRLIERIESLVESVNAMSARRMGHNDQSRALVAHLKEAVKFTKAMAKSWRNI